MSTVLNKSHTSSVVSKKKAELIRRIADQYGYLPHGTGKMLVNGRTDTIAVFANYADNLEKHPEMVRFIGHASAALRIHDKHLVCLDTAQMHLSANGLPKIVAERRVDGVLLVEIERVMNLIARLKHFKIPWIGTSVTDFQERANCIMGGDRNTIELSVNHLLAIGHRKIGYVHYDIERKEEEQRYAGIENAVNLSKATVLFAASPYHYGDDNAFQQSWKTLVCALFPEDKKDQWPTGILCDSDWIALAVMRAAKERGLVIPGDISIIGCGNTPECAFAEPSLTTLAEGKSCGKLAVDMLLERIRNDGEDVPNVSNRAILIERRSTGPVKTM